MMISNLFNFFIVNVFCPLKSHKLMLFHSRNKYSKHFSFFLLWVLRSLTKAVLLQRSLLVSTDAIKRVYHLVEHDDLVLTVAELLWGAEKITFR